MNFNNKVAIVTGGTSGIGRGVVKALSDRGVRLIINGRDEEKGQNLIKTLNTHWKN